MKIKAKLTAGIGLLCLMIAALLTIGIYSLTSLKQDTANILHANYNTLDYTKDMLVALEDIKADTAAVKIFESKLAQQQANITEAGERAVTERVAIYFKQYRAQQYDPEILSFIRRDLSTLMALNMEAISRKSAVAGDTAQQTILILSIVGTVCFIIAFVLLFNLPGNIADPITQLTASIRQIANQDYKQRLHFEAHNEFGALARSFNIMAEKLEEYSESKLDKIIQGKKRIDALINNMHDPVIGLDERKIVLFANQELLKISGLKQEDFIGRPIQDVAIHNDLMRAITRDLFPLDENPLPASVPLKIYADGKESYFQKQIVPIDIIPTGEQDARFIGQVIMLRNITPYKELDLAKTNFIATISHELKTPISSIKMSLQLLAHVSVGSMNKEQTDLTNSIAEDTDRLLKIIGELLNMTQVESGTIQLNIDTVSPLEIVNIAKDSNRQAAMQKGIELVVEIAQQANFVKADKDKTAWVLTNLISNAIKYSNDGATVTIDVSAEDDDVKFSVKDAGPGIATEYHEKIFTRYFRAPGSRRDGTGLGLSISKEFIEAQNGRISVSSQPGWGSVFSFWLKQ